jgi:hypothetical protein
MPVNNALSRFGSGELAEEESYADREGLPHCLGIAPVRQHYDGNMAIGRRPSDELAALRWSWRTLHAANAAAD